MIMARHRSKSQRKRIRGLGGCEMMKNQLPHQKTTVAHFSMNTGDQTQIKALRIEYNYHLRLKDDFISQAGNAYLNPTQLAEVEMKLAKITGELKRIDALVHYLMFGGVMTMNEVMVPKQIIYNIQESREMAELKAKMQSLSFENKCIKDSLSYYQRKAKQEPEYILTPELLNQ